MIPCDGRSLNRPGPLSALRLPLRCARCAPNHLVCVQEAEMVKEARKAQRKCKRNKQKEASWATKFMREREGLVDPKDRPKPRTIGPGRVGMSSRRRWLERNLWGNKDPKIKSRGDSAREERGAPQEGKHASGKAEEPERADSSDVLDLSDEAPKVGASLSCPTC